MLIPPQGPYPHPLLGVTAPQCCVKNRLNGAGRHSTECGEGTVIMLLDCLINGTIQNKCSAVWSRAWNLGFWSIKITNWKFYTISSLVVTWWSKSFILPWFSRGRFWFKIAFTTGFSTLYVNTKEIRLKMLSASR